jgi:hypothetical protein
MVKSSRVAAFALASMLCGAAVAIADDSKPAPVPAHKPAPDRACLQQTGTRIPVKSSDCAGYGRDISRREIDQTGASSVGGALKLLGPPMTH